MTQHHDAVIYELQYLSNNYTVTLGEFFNLPGPQNLKLGMVPIPDLVMPTFEN